MKILIDSKIPYVHGVFEPYMQTQYLDAADFTPSIVKNADAMLVRTRTRCDDALLHGSGIKFIASATIGCDHIDADYCRQYGIAWSNAPGCNAGAVLQYVAAAILEVAQRKNIVLRGKTIGIVGVGHVGRLVAQFSRQVGMTALLCDPPRAQQEGMAGFCSLHQIAASADIITFHTPLTHEGRHATFHLADSAFFSKLSRNPVFINTSRGEVVDEPALRHAIANKKVSAAILDVWEGEPLISQATLALTAIGTPHIAGYSIQGKRMAAQMAVRALAYYFHLPLLEWTPEPLPPLPIPMVKPKNQHELHAFCHSFYDIAADDACLRAAPHTAERLRSMYALRQELPLDSMTIF